MARRSILETLEPLVSEKLEELDARWHAQPEGNRRPTLPLTDDGKVNVRELAVTVCGLPRAQEQHFYKKPSLAALVNAIAARQGVKPIGSRALSDVADKAVKDRLVRAQGERDDHARLLAEREAVIERQRLQILSLTEQLRLLQETGMVVRTGDVT
ncbi:hypothetical protein ILT44_06995 [Microvirga sp. BT689]|uniref:hypothetical protein n=1 Tax=Microvirga arvi TaxID=2778731 RepID=UPI00194FBA5E|nr:hypothetical protein [Microvirga arvi]MBM6579922.1 hypothetical protein [Microvirga arvi]